MRILLVGEFSAFHKYLAEGLKQLGHEVTKMATGDGWKKIPGADIELYKTTGKTKLGKILSGYYSGRKAIQNLGEYDVIQLINPRIYSTVYNKCLLKKMFKAHKGIISIVAAGGDLAVHNAYEKGVFDYYVYDYDKIALSAYDNNTFMGKRRCKDDIFVIEESDIIVPTLYEYGVGYQGNNKTTGVIPAPVNLEGIKYKENIAQDKVVIFHGVNREAAKGTPFIREALEVIKEKYGDKVEVIIDGKIPFDQYVKLMERTNVVVDQCCTYGYGINALIAMAQGKIVLSGARKETIKAFGMKEDECALYHISPDVDTIVKQLSFVVENKEKISVLGKQSREYVEKYHDCKKVAQKYVDAWMQASR